MPTYLLTLTAPERVATVIADALAEGARIAADAAGAFDRGDGTWGLEAYFPGPVEPDDLVDALTDAFAGADDLGVDDLFAALSRAHLRPLDGADWSDLELDQLPPIVAGRFRVFGEHNRPAASARLGRNDLVIEASTAFGTGDHASTYLSLVHLDRLLKLFRPRHVLDLGTGTGLLAIAVARVVPDAAIVASDIEPVAVAMTDLNARANATPQVRAVLADGLHHPDIRAGGPYDLVLANILPDPLSRLAASVVATMARGGVLVIAGLRQGEEARMISAYRTRGLVFAAAERAKEWSSLVFVKR